ncbi:hypothetical protein KIN20_000086 [Parelaphostrongylus tenuis]|uniref:Uncharacterized protein n=1 Tax=Parelaphostrongylus tenuis TaxID=148309 RepID=A0AAD5LU91_PARTN|nr:hypothetical protein KIN20_000086 [Parelaphostrongylus tenuis]
MDSDLSQFSRSSHPANADDGVVESLSETWNDVDYTNDEDDNDPLTLQSNMETDSPQRVNCSLVESIYRLATPRTPSPESDLTIPITPRDDVLTRSPTLLRAPSSVSRALFSKIQIRRVPSDKADLNNRNAASNCLKNTWNCAVGYSLPYVNVRSASSSMELDGGDQINDDSEDAPGSEVYSAGDELDVGSKTRMKRRTRTEKERMGFERMQSSHHRTRQMINLARKIAMDIKQRLFMHQDVWHTVERTVLGGDNLEGQFDRLKDALFPKHADVLVLLSLLADESVLPPGLLTSPLRRAYHGAVQMLLAIEAYFHGTRSRSSNTRSLLKTIGNMGNTLSEVEFCDRLADLLGNERPLWNYIRQWLPLPYDEKVTAADFEFVDLCRRTDSQLIEYDGAECIDDLNAVLGSQPLRKGGSLQVHAGQLNSLQNGVYVPIVVSKADEENVQRITVENRCDEPVWTKEVDILILNTYNEIDGSNEEIVKDLARKLPYSCASIERRLNFLVSLF